MHNNEDWNHWGDKSSDLYKRDKWAHSYHCNANYHAKSYKEHSKMKIYFAQMHNEKAKLLKKLKFKKSK